MVFSQYECLFIKCSSYVKRKSKSLIVFLFTWVFIPFASFRWFLLLLVPRSFLIINIQTIICILHGRGARPQKNCCVYELFNFSS